MTACAYVLGGTTELQKDEVKVDFNLPELQFECDISVPPRHAGAGKGLHPGAGATFPGGQFWVLPPILFSNVAAS